MTSKCRLRRCWTSFQLFTAVAEDVAPEKIAAEGAGRVEEKRRNAMHDDGTTFRAVF